MMTIQIEKAHESLQAAELCFANGLHNSAASRAYYAMFQAAVVALEAAGILPDGKGWSHAGLQATFALELTRRRKLYPHSMAEMLTKGLEISSLADYARIHVSERRTAQMLRWANEFVRQVEEEVEDGHEP